MAIENQKNSFSPSAPNEKTTTYNIDDLAREPKRSDSASSSASPSSSSTSSSSNLSSSSDDVRQSYSNHQGTNQVSAQSSAIDMLRGSVVGVLDSVVREYEPQIAEFTSNMAHQAVERGVEFASATAAKVQKQSWLRIGLAAALGVGIIAVLSYEASEAASDSSSARRRPTH